MAPYSHKLPRGVGEIAETTAVATNEEVANSHPPAKWEDGYKGPKFMDFPLAEEYSVHKGKIPLDEATASDITKTNLRATRCRQLSAIGAPR
eukprot:scaffold8697_cov33-Tisochrysis_lutea.AAC.6